jgi:hypothetical protein
MVLVHIFDKEQHRRLIEREKDSLPSIMRDYKTFSTIVYCDCVFRSIVYRYDRVKTSIAILERLRAAPEMSPRAIIPLHHHRLQKIRTGSNRLVPATVSGGQSNRKVFFTRSDAYLRMCLQAGLITKATSFFESMMSPTSGAWNKARVEELSVITDSLLRRSGISEKRVNEEISLYRPYVCGETQRNTFRKKIKNA